MAMQFEDPQLVLVGHAREVVRGNGGCPRDNSGDNDSPNALDLGLDD